MTSVTTNLLGRRRGVRSTSLSMVGLGLLVSAGGLVASLVVEVGDGGPHAWALAWSLVLTTALGLGCRVMSRTPDRVTPVAAFAAVSFTWIAVSVAGALPFLLSGALGVQESIFESVSGFTATGATVLAPIADVSDGVLFWRSFTQWYGGMGMIVLAVAILPFLGVGGLELLQAEGPGPTNDSLAPRVRETARRLWQVYVGLTALSTVAMLAVGTNLYDAVTHSFTAVATGGFSRYDASVAHFDSVAVEAVLMAAMVLGGINFALHWRVLLTRRPGAYVRRSELRVWLAIMAVATLVATVVNRAEVGTWARSLREAVFTVVSVSTTTGFGISDLNSWAPAGQLILLFLMVFGAMAGSTSGAVKVFRVQVALRYLAREVRQALHPRASLPLRVGGHAVPEDTVSRAVGFVQLYFVVAVMGIVALMVFGLDFTAATGASLTSMGGVGPGLGSTAVDFTGLTLPALAVTDVLMLLGRLEIFPMLLMFVAATETLERRRHERRRLRRLAVEPAERRGRLAARVQPASGSGTRSGSAARR